MTTESNPYESPQATISEVSDIEHILASRWSRLGAAFLDMIFMLIIVLPFIIAGYFSAEAPEWAERYNWFFEETLANTVLAFIYTGVGFLILHGYLLARFGQTIGKKIVGIKVVDYQSGELISFNRMIGLRYLPLWIVESIPVVGGFLSLADSLAIFGSERRCIHDYIANTKVVNC